MNVGDSTDGRYWVDRLRRNDMPVHELLESFRPELLRLATRICGEHDAEDAVQEALLRAAERLSTFRGETDAQLRAWLRTIVRNQCLAPMRTKRHRVSTDVGQPDPTFVADVPDSIATPSQEARRNEECERLTRLLGKLTPDQLDAISYRYFEEWSISEIAHQMDKSESAVMGLLARALARLRLDTSPSEWSRILK